MRIAYSWLKEYIDLELSPEELAEKLTLAGVEVEAVEQFAEISDRVVWWVKIITLKPHPHNSRLLVAGVDPGDGAPCRSSVALLISPPARRFLWLFPGRCCREEAAWRRSRSRGSSLKGCSVQERSWAWSWVRPTVFSSSILRPKQALP